MYKLFISMYNNLQILLKKKTILKKSLKIDIHLL